MSSEVASIVFNDTGEVLLQKSRENTWGLPRGSVPGGGVGAGSAKRIIREQTGVETQVIGRLQPAELKPRGDSRWSKVDWFIMTAEDSARAFKAGGWAYFPPQEAQELLTSSEDRRRLEAALDRSAQSGGVSLSPNHRRVLTGTLSRIERRLDLAEAHLARAEQGRLYRMENPLVEDVARRTALFGILAELRCQLREIADMFELQPLHIERPRELAAEFSLLWTEAEELRPQALDAYGPLEAAVKSALEPHIQVLAKGLLELADNLGAKNAT